ncbi:glycosyl transferase family protein [Salmonella enterica subsp. arizonae]|nr:glycosyl transferase family protein [Salmonella enterica subsp. arizonae]
MKVSFFLLKFPLSSETFVLNQITAFIDMGHEVEIVALQKGDTQHTHAAWEKYGLAAKTRWLQDEPQGRLAKLRYRACKTLPGLHRAATWKALNFTRYGDESRNLILSAILRAGEPAFWSGCVHRALWPGGRDGGQTTRTGRASRQNCDYFPRD